MKIKTLLVFCLLACAAGAAVAAPKKILVVTVTAGFRHTEGINASEKILPALAQRSGAFTIDWCKQPEGQPPAPKKPKAPAPGADDAAQARFKEQQAQYETQMAAYRPLEAEYRKKLAQALEVLRPVNLKNYDAVIFDNTSGEMPLPDHAGFLEWIKSGKAFIGIHAATDTLRSHTLPDGTKPYIAMIGAEFDGHGPQVSVDVINQDPAHAACKDVPKSWVVYDEIYRMKNFDRKTVHGLLTLDKHPNDKTPGDFPVAWCKAYGKGRVFYTSLGHRADVWDDATEPNYKRQNDPQVARTYQQHLLSGILWALGLAPGSAEPQVK